MYDEAIDVIDAEEVITPPMSAAMADESRRRNSLTEENSDETPRETPRKVRTRSKDESVGSTRKHLEESERDAKTSGQWGISDRGLVAQLSDHSENSDEDEDDDDVRAPTLQGGYDPGEYEELAVSSEVKELFSHITKYVPQTIELDTKLSPFLPDFIPAVGDIDGFLKVPRPDGAKDGLGLTVLDEPCTVQTDPVVLQLQLRAQAKQTEDKALVVKKVANADSNMKAVDKWIRAISDLHQRKPPPTVHYTKPMPNLDNLMQEWPEKMEEQFESMTVPSPDLDCDFSTYVTILCNLFDIPVYDTKIQSLHMFFNLYSTMKSTRAQLVQESEPGNQSPLV